MANVNQKDKLAARKTISNNVPNDLTDAQVKPKPRRGKRKKKY